MKRSLDRRVVPQHLLALVQACQRVVPALLGGGAALSGAHLAHRLSRDLDLVCRSVEELRLLVRSLPQVAEEEKTSIWLLRDAGSFARAHVEHPAGSTELDIVLEGTPSLEPPELIEGIRLESLADLRAAKLTCLLSRAEPRDLVDLLFLDRSGYPPEHDLHLALRKNAGIDPGVLAWLLGSFPVAPLPLMLAPLTEGELARFRDDLRERLRRAALP